MIDKIKKLKKFKKAQNLRKIPKRAACRGLYLFILNNIIIFLYY